jgi:hypothetical protein
VLPVGMRSESLRVLASSRSILNSSSKDQRVQHKNLMSWFAGTKAPTAIKVTRRITTAATAIRVSRTTK